MSGSGGGIASMGQNFLSGLKKGFLSKWMRDTLLLLKFNKLEFLKSNCFNY
jgi:hypothetical protein